MVEKVNDFAFVLIDETGWKANERDVQITRLAPPWHRPGNTNGAGSLERVHGTRPRMVLLPFRKIWKPSRAPSRAYTALER